MISTKSLSKKSIVQWKPKMPKYKIVLYNDSYRAPHPLWNMKEAEKVEITHVSPKTWQDKYAYYNMKALRYWFDLLTGYKPGNMTEHLYLRRVIFLETIAGVPGMVGGAMRHLRSLRGMSEDGGWIHHLLEEAENERMHLQTFLRIRQPGVLMRIWVLGSQAVFLSYYTLTYLISPKLSHRFVGYLEEEAVKTYTNLIKEIDEGLLPYWDDKPAGEEAIKYWGLTKDAKLRDVLVAIRADEVMHREYNHHFADIPADSPIKGHTFILNSNNDPIVWDDAPTEKIEDGGAQSIGKVQQVTGDTSKSKTEKSKYHGGSEPEIKQMH